METAGERRERPSWAPSAAQDDIISTGGVTAGSYLSGHISSMYYSTLFSTSAQEVLCVKSRVYLIYRASEAVVEGNSKRELPSLAVVTVAHIFH